MSAPTKLSSAIALAFILASTTAAAADFNYSLYTGIEHSDNINLRATDPVSQSSLIPGVSFTYERKGEDLQANVIGDLEYHDYLGSRFKNQTQLELASQLNWKLIPERLDLSVQDYAGIQPLDTLASDAPDNQQQTNVFAIGPVFHFRMGDTVSGQAELRYINGYAEKTRIFNSHRSQGALRILKALNPTDQLSVNVSTQHVNFYNSPINANYRRNEIYAGYTSRLTYFDINAAIGQSQINYDQTGIRNQTSPLVRANVSWRPTESSSFTVDVRHQYSDAAQDLMLPPGQVPNANSNGISTGDAVVNAEVYLERQIELTYALHTERLTLSLSPRYRKIDYDNDPTYDQTGRGANAAIDFRLRQTLVLSAYATGERLDYRSIGRNDKTMIYGLQVAKQLSQHWSWRAALMHQRRNSNLAEQNFHENRIYFGVTFKR
ncbi:MAG: outer membrane beta-barrel protein [Rhodanobacter sp.]